MTKQFFPKRRLLLGACAAMMILMTVLGVHTRAALQSRALEREMASVQTFRLDGGASPLAQRLNAVPKNSDVTALGL